MAGVVILPGGQAGRNAVAIAVIRSPRPAFCRSWPSNWRWPSSQRSTGGGASWILTP